MDEIHITVPGRPDDPRRPLTPPPGVVTHYVPELHPDDRVVVDGIPVTAPGRTLVDAAECSDRDELRSMFLTGLRRGIVTMDEVRAARARVEWRPSLAMLDEVIAELS